MTAKVKKQPKKIVVKSSNSYREFLLNSLKNSLKVVGVIGGGAVAIAALKKAYNLSDDNYDLARFVNSINTLLSSINIRALTTDQVANLRETMRFDWPMMNEGGTSMARSVVNALYTLVESHVEHLPQAQPTNFTGTPNVYTETSDTRVPSSQSVHNYVNESVVTTNDFEFMQTPPITQGTKRKRGVGSFQVSYTVAGEPSVTRRKKVAKKEFLYDDL
jgi:hypothetical protein